MKSVDCPYCDGKAELHIERTSKTFRKEQFEINENYYKCNKCGKEFTTTEIDEVNVKGVYEMYREVHPVEQTGKNRRENRGNREC